MKKFNDMVFKFLVEPAIKIFGIALCLVIMLQIFGRTFMSTPPSWTEEVSRFTFVWYCFLGAAYTMRQKQHLGLDYFYMKFNPKFRHFIDIVINLCVTVFGLYTAVYGTTLLEIVSRRKAPITGWGMQWFYLVMPIMGVLFALVGIEFLLDVLKEGKSKGKEGEAA